MKEEKAINRINKYTQQLQLYLLLELYRNINIFNKRGSKRYILCRYIYIYRLINNNREEKNYIEYRLYYIYYYINHTDDGTYRIRGTFGNIIYSK